MNGGCEQSEKKTKLDKGDYCLYCSKLFKKLKDHLLARHGEAPDVQIMKNFPPEIKEVSQRVYTRIRLDGNHQHNMQVHLTGKGETRRARTTEDKTSRTFPCQICHAWLLPTLFKKHKCPLSEPGEKPSIANSRRLLKDAETEESDGMKRILQELRSDDIGLAIKNDPTLMGYLRFKASTHLVKSLKQERELLQASIRSVAKLLLYLRGEKLNVYREFSDLLSVAAFKDVVRATMHVGLRQDRAALQGVHHNRLGCREDCAARSSTRIGKVGRDEEKCKRILRNKGISVVNTGGETNPLRRGDGCQQLCVGHSFFRARPPFQCKDNRAAGSSH